ncbi:MAG: hypothetical protein LBD82_01570 [Deltaproteobacteria bacterium]|jgi:hypothetical protein|nr:hypothetical protein [Deltaproteobacteria bacterium]
MPGAIYSSYELTKGIQDILPAEQSVLPERAALAPTDAASSNQLGALYAARNFEAVIAAFLRPSVRNLENLSPERYRKSLRRCKEALRDSAGPSDPAQAALAALLEEEAEHSGLLASFQGLLLAG